MLTQYILIPVFVLVARTFVLLWFVRDARGGAPDARRDALLLDPFDVLFYVLVAYLIPVHRADWIMVALGCASAVLRTVRAAAACAAAGLTACSPAWSPAWCC